MHRTVTEPRLMWIPALVLPLVLACSPAVAPTPTPTPTPTPAAPAGMDAAAAVAAAATITPAGVSREVHALAHDSTRGRYTPSPELEKVAVYLAHRFSELGLEPGGSDGSYMHRWDYDVVKLDRQATRVRVPGQDRPEPTLEADYFVIPGLRPGVRAPLFYGGTAGEVRRLPADASGTIVVFDLPGPELGMEWNQRLAASLEPAAAAAGILFVLDPDFPRDILAQLAIATAEQQAPVPVIGMAEEAAVELIAAAGGDLGAARGAAPSMLGDAEVEVTVGRRRDVHQPPNVVAIRRGADPSLRDSYVLITAHFDHLGVGEPDERGDSIFSGADDNASGTAALLEMASAFMALPGPPARSVVFLAVSGEEKGLLGSLAFAENPTIPLADVVANINLDMVGRTSPDTIIAIGQEYSTLEGLIRRIADRPGIGLTIIEDPEPEKMFFFRSDQLSFIQRGIPAVFFTTGDHPDYHQQSDLPERIDDEKLARVARLAFHLALEIAMDPQAPEWTDEGWREVERLLRGSPF
jgi:hypothetical protein